MIFSRKSGKKEKNLKHENAILRSALEIILSEIENARPESAKAFALMALRGERHDQVTDESREIRKMRVYSTERRSRQNGFFNTNGGRLLVANS
jgi:hypothetical protein